MKRWLGLMVVALVLAVPRQVTRIRLWLVLLALVELTGCTWYRNIRTGPAVDLRDGNGVILTIMAFNIRVGYGAEDPGVSPWVLRDRSKTLDRIVASIRSVDPDILGLQEVLGEPQAREIAKALNMNYAYAAHSDTSPPWWGVAILSKYRILEARSKLISERPSYRQMVIAKLDIAGIPVDAASVHVDVDSRTQSLRATTQVMESLRAPAIVAGDFNTAPMDTALNQIRQRFIDTAEVANTVDRPGFPGELVT